MVNVFRVHSTDGVEVGSGGVDDTMFNGEWNIGSMGDVGWVQEVGRDPIVLWGIQCRECNREFGLMSGCVI